MKKRILMMIFGILLLWNNQGIIYAAGQNEEDSPASYRSDMELKINSIEESGISRQRSGSGMEASYRSPYITSVKSQGSYGTCWAFSYIAASEASLWKHGLAGGDVDLSEWHLAYFLAHSVTDPLGGTKGDYFTVDGDYLKAGANQQLATFRVANWYGLVDEETAHYETVKADSTATLADSTAYDKDVAHLENAYWVAMKDRNIIKQLIKEYGACGTSYCSANQYYNVSYPYNTETEVASYCPNEVKTDHGVTIVGWDDNYGRENFNADCQPKTDGAWYCKNSWSSDWSKDGYFWISYEDVPLLNSVGFFYDYGIGDNYDYNYQYDGGAWGNYYASCKYEANMYQAKGQERLKAVGFYTRDAKYQCKVSVYKGCEEGKPTSGELVLSQDANQLYAGFHTVELDEVISLKEGERFSIVIRQMTEDGGNPEISVDSNVTDSWCSNTSNAEDGQSFVSVSGKYWYDISAYSEQYEGRENCRIKAYTDDAMLDSDILVTEIQLEKDTYVLELGETVSLNASVLPENATDNRLKWTTSDTAVVEVDTNGVIKAVGKGEATITCKAKDGSEVTAVCSVTVTQPVTGIRLDYSELVMYVDAEKQISCTVLPENANNKEVEWSSSNEDVVKVSKEGCITAIGYGEAEITCSSIANKDISDVCLVSVKEIVKRISFNLQSATLKIGDKIQLTTEIEPSLKTTNGVYWVSNNTAVATVDNLGSICAVSSGSAVIECRAKDGKGAVAKINISVEEPVQSTEQPPEQSMAEQPDTSVKIPPKGSLISDGKASYKVVQTDMDNAAVEYSKCLSSSKKITIPYTIHIDGVTYKVTAIGNNAFKNNKRITTLETGSGIKTIGKYAFYGCSKLSTVTIGKNVSGIGKKAFYNCKKLKLVKIKTTKLHLERVGSNAFKGIYSKAVIKVPKKKMKEYQSLLKKRGIGPKVKVKKL